nr:3809_t:CDS:2 [Entrophospora candida]
MDSNCENNKIKSTITAIKDEGIIDAMPICHHIFIPKIQSQRRTKLTTKALENISKLHMYYFSNIKRVNYGQNLSVDEVNSGCLTTTTDMLESDTDCL